MKKIIMILIAATIGLAACKKEDIKPNTGTYIENIDDVEDIDDNNAHISDSMMYVSIKILSNNVSKGININNDGIEYPVYSNSVDSSVYVSNGWNPYGYGLGSSWSGWIKPESYVIVFGEYTGMGSNVFDFDITVQINNGTLTKKTFNITTSNKTYMHIFYVK